MQLHVCSTTKDLRDQLGAHAHLVTGRRSPLTLQIGMVRGQFTLCSETTGYAVSAGHGGAAGPMQTPPQGAAYTFTAFQKNSMANSASRHLQSVVMPLTSGCPSSSCPDHQLLHGGVGRHCRSYAAGALLARLCGWGGNSRNTALTSSDSAPMPVQAAHCCAFRGCVEKTSPPNWTMSTCGRCAAHFRTLP